MELTGHDHFASADGLMRSYSHRASSLWGLCVDGTSGTFTVTSAEGTPLIDALMYDDATALEEAEQVAAVAPPTSAALGASSPLAKLMRLIKARPDLATDGRVLHQADWISNRLLGTIGVSDESNSLKMGSTRSHALGRVGFASWVSPKTACPRWSGAGASSETRIAGGVPLVCRRRRGSSRARPTALQRFLRRVPLQPAMASRYWVRPSSSNCCPRLPSLRRSTACCDHRFVWDP